MWAGSSGNVIAVLRDLDAKAIAWPAALKQAARVPTSRDDLCAAYFREAVGRDLLRDRLVRTEDHFLIVLRRGNLVIESAQGPLTVRQGDSAFVSTGWRRITEVPANDGPVSYWIIFFGPALIRTVFSENELFRQAASQVALAFSGVYIQRGLLPALSFYGCDGPVPNVEKTFRAIGARLAASFFMFLQEHYYAWCETLQRLVRVCTSSRCPVEQIGAGWPGGPRAFRQEFKLYHGVSVQTWVQRKKKAQRDKRAQRSREKL